MNYLTNKSVELCTIMYNALQKVNKTTEIQFVNCMEGREFQCITAIKSIKSALFQYYLFKIF